MLTGPDGPESLDSCPMIITIDGPAGSGKSTAARKLAQALGIAYLDTGATYRAVTLAAMRRAVDLADETALAAVARSINLQLIPKAAGLVVLLDGLDVSREIRSAEVSEQSRYAAASPKVRIVLVEMQRRLGQELGSFVTEGRDQGSVVFPDADFKFYLDAAPAVRARRRLEELQTADPAADYEQVLAAIVERDRRDRSRPVAPLLKPDDAIEVDTSDFEIEQTTQRLLEYVERRR